MNQILPYSFASTANANVENSIDEYNPLSSKNIAINLLKNFPRGTYYKYKLPLRNYYAISFVNPWNNLSTLYFTKIFSGFAPYAKNEDWIDNKKLYPSLSSVINSYQELFQYPWLSEEAVRQIIEDPMHFEKNVLYHHVMEELSNIFTGAYLITNDPLTDDYILYWSEKLGVAKYIPFTLSKEGLLLLDDGRRFANFEALKKEFDLKESLLTLAKIFKESCLIGSNSINYPKNDDWAEIKSPRF